MNIWQRSSSQGKYWFFFMLVGRYLIEGREWLLDHPSGRETGVGIITFWVTTGHTPVVIPSSKYTTTFPPVLEELIPWNTMITCEILCCRPFCFLIHYNGIVCHFDKILSLSAPNYVILTGGWKLSCWQLMMLAMIEFCQNDISMFWCQRKVIRNQLCLKVLKIWYLTLESTLQLLTTPSAPPPNPPKKPQA